MTEKQDIDIRDMFVRQPVPGENFSFDALEAHCLFMGLHAVRAFLDEEDYNFVQLYASLKGKEEEYKLSNVRGQLPDPMIITSDDYLRGFFTSFVALMRWHLWCLSDEVINEHGEEQEFRFPICEHTIDEHMKILTSWAEREIELPKKFASSRIAVENLPADIDKVFGLPFITRKDLERVIKEELERLEASISDEDEELIQKIVDLGRTREQAQETIKSMHNTTLNSTREDLERKYKNIYRILE